MPKLQLKFLWLLISVNLILYLPANSASLARNIFPDSLQLLKQLEVPAASGWVDTGIDVKEGEKYEFRASGTISCQKGNPIASCGPEGLDLQTVQQPMPDHNLGAFIGKVVKVISVTKDQETGEENKEEVSKVFFIGPRAEVEMDLEGRLYLGVNDNVYADNDGKFIVEIYRKAENKTANKN